jgi:hypothetical protein
MYAIIYFAGFLNSPDGDRVTVCRWWHVEKIQQRSQATRVAEDPAANTKQFGNFLAHFAQNQNQPDALKLVLTSGNLKPGSWPINHFRSILINYPTTPTVPLFHPTPMITTYCRKRGKGLKNGCKSLDMATCKNSERLQTVTQLGCYPIWTLRE